MEEQREVPKTSLRTVKEGTVDLGKGRIIGYQVVVSDKKVIEQKKKGNLLTRMVKTFKK